MLQHAFVRPNLTLWVRLCILICRALSFLRARSHQPQGCTGRHDAPRGARFEAHKLSQTQISKMSKPLGPLQMVGGAIEDEPTKWCPTLYAQTQSHQPSRMRSSARHGIGLLCPCLIGKLLDVPPHLGALGPSDVVLTKSAPCMKQAGLSFTKHGIQSEPASNPLPDG